MKKTLLKLAVVSGMLVTMTATVNAQWTRNAVTSKTYLTNTADFLGLGTTNPAFKLDVQSTGIATMSFKSTSDNASILLDRGASTKTASLTYRTGGVNNWQTGCVANNNFQIRNNVLASPAFYIDSATNNVGVGTTSPFSQLSNTNTNIYGTDGYGLSTTSLGWKSDGFGYAAGFYNPSTSIASNGVTIKIAGNTGTILDMSASDTVSVMTVKGNGKVGIGTSTPNRQLVVKSSSTSADAEVSELANGIGDINFHLVGMKGSTTNNVGDAMLKFGMVYGDNGSSLKSALIRFHRGWAGDDGDISFSSYNDATETMRIASSGYVGIGTAAPNYTLEVNGTAGKPGGGSWTATSDARLKQNVQQYNDGLAQIMKINPVKYHYNETSGYDVKPEYVGVLAQEIKEVAPYMVGTFTKEGKEYYNVDNSAMTYMLINAVKELGAKLEDAKAENANLKSCVESLCNSSLENAASKVGVTAAQDALFQNQPNPFNALTVITYSLVKSENAQIIIRDLSGNTIKSFNLAQSGKGQVTVNANELAQGTYTYTLVVNSNAVDTKLMVITK